MQIDKHLRIDPSARVRLAKIATDATPGCHDKEAALTGLGESLEELRKLQYRLFAENRRAVLVVLQAMDAAGKDGVVRHVLSGLNPQACRVTSFKVPSALEKQHDFLWRIHQAVPPMGEIGVFNRSHYEDVLVARVRQLAPPAVWKARFAMINDFERYLSDNGVTIVKFFLHLSRTEQARRLQDRLKDPERNWKFTPADIEERRFWDDYQSAYEDVLARCSTSWAPWFVIPADHKWYRNWAVAEILRHTLWKMDLRFPPPLHDARDLRRRLRAQEARKR
jgi:PPK2 family polyphosphate:nucleotide phosphotransferase